MAAYLKGIGAIDGSSGRSFGLLCMIPRTGDRAWFVCFLHSWTKLVSSSNSANSMELTIPIAGFGIGRDIIPLSVLIWTYKSVVIKIIF